MKKLLVVFVAVCLVLASVNLALAREGKLTMKTEVLERSDMRALIKTGDIYHQITVKKDQVTGKTSIIDTLTYYTEPTSSYGYDDGLGGYQDAGDTCVHQFTLLAPGKVNKFFMQNQSAGTATCYIWTAVDWDSSLYIYPDDPKCEMLVPYGIPLSCNSQDPAAQFTDGAWTPEWNVLDFTTVLGDGIYLDDDDRYCWVGYSTDGSGNPKILQDNDYHEDTHRSLSTLHAVGNGWYNWGADIDGVRHSAYHIMQLEVEYDAVPPVVEEVYYPSDTFAPQTTIYADVVDLDENNFNVWVKFWWNEDDGSRDSVEMSLVDGDLYTATLDLTVGDTLHYYIKARDENGLWKTSDDYEVMRLPEPDPATALLLVDDGGQQNDSLYTMTLDDLGYRYYLWDMAKHNGIDESVIHWGFHTMVVFGWGTSIVPITDVATEDYYDIKGFIDAGNNLMLVDMDYLYAWGMPETGEFEAGDFAYDYLGLGTFHSDPDTDGDGSNGGSADVEMNGVRNDPLTMNFRAPDSYGVIDYDLVSWSNWGDYIDANANATTIFTEKGGDNNSMAVRYEGSNFRTVTFAFPIELCADYSEFRTLLDQSMTWLDITTTDVDEQVNVPAEFSLEQNYPNPFNPTTQIRYNVPRASRVTIAVYDILGHKVAELVNAKKNAGSYTVQWDGRDLAGRSVAAGIYLYEMKAGSFSQMQKMFLIK